MMSAPMTDNVLSHPAAVEAYRRRNQREQITAIRRKLRTLDKLAVEICSHTMEINRRLHALEYGSEWETGEADPVKALQRLERDADGG